MVTTNANDSRQRESRNVEGRRAKEGNYRSASGKGGSRENKNYNGRPYNKEERSGADQRENKTYHKSAYNNGTGYNKVQREGTSKEKEFRNSGADYRQTGRSAYNKDWDDKSGDARYNKGFSGGKDQRNKDSNVKEKEQQPDKVETMRRLEKEKKAMQKKKENNRKTEKSSRPQPKMKRGAHIDWTKGYENGLYNDDDEDYTIYL